MRQLGARPETRSVRPAASYWSIVRLSLAALPGAGAFSVSILALGGHRTNDHTIGWKPANVRAEDHRCVNLLLHPPKQATMLDLESSFDLKTSENKLRRICIRVDDLATVIAMFYTQLPASISLPQLPLFSTFCGLADTDSQIPLVVCVMFQVLSSQLCSHFCFL